MDYYQKRRKTENALMVANTSERRRLLAVRRSETRQHRIETDNPSTLSYPCPVLSDTYQDAIWNILERNEYE